jgi:hypothetical protein
VSGGEVPGGYLAIGCFLACAFILGSSREGIGARSTGIAKIMVILPCQFRFMDGELPGGRVMSEQGILKQRHIW